MHRYSNAKQLKAKYQVLDVPYSGKHCFKSVKCGKRDIDKVQKVWWEYKRSYSSCLCFTEKSCWWSDSIPFALLSSVVDKIMPLPPQRCPHHNWDLWIYYITRRRGIKFTGEFKDCKDPPRRGRGIQVANPLVWRWRNYAGGSGGAQRDHKGPSKQKREAEKSQHDSIWFCHHSWL